MVLNGLHHWAGAWKNKGKKIWEKGVLGERHVDEPMKQGRVCKDVVLIPSGNLDIKND